MPWLAPVIRMVAMRPSPFLEKPLDVAVGGLAEGRLSRLRQGAPEQPPLGKEMDGAVEGHRQILPGGGVEQAQVHQGGEHPALEGQGTRNIQRS